MGKESHDQGRKDASKGEKDPVSYAFNEDYKRGYDHGQGLKDGSKAAKEIDRHPISGSFADALGSGLDTFGKSNDYKEGYNRGRSTYGKDTNQERIERNLFGGGDRSRPTNESSGESCSGSGGGYGGSSSRPTSSSGGSSSFIKGFIIFIIITSMIVGFLYYCTECMQRDIARWERQSSQTSSQTSSNTTKPKSYLYRIEPGKSPAPNEWRAERRTLSHSSDNGRTWDILLSISSMPHIWWDYIDYVLIKDRQNIVIELAGGVNENIITEDGGKTWEDRIYHGRHYGSITIRSITRDNGKTWEEVDYEIK